MKFRRAPFPKPLSRSPFPKLRCGYERQLYEAGFSRSVIDSLHGFSVVSGFGPEDVRHKCLRVSVVERKPRRLNLNHNSMALQKNVIRSRQSEAVGQRFVRFDGLLRFDTVELSTAEDVHDDYY